MSPHSISRKRRGFRRSPLSFALACAVFASACASTSAPAARTESVEVSSAQDESGSTVARTDPPSSTAPADVAILRDGRVSDAALAAMVRDGVPDAGLVDSAVAAIQGLPADAELSAWQDLARRYELQAAEVSGLQKLVGGEQATQTAIDGAWAKVAAMVDAADASVPLQPAVKPSGFAQAPADDSATPGAVGALGVLLAATGISLVADPVVSASNDFTRDQYGESNNSGLSIAAGLEAAAIELAYEGAQDGVAVSFKTSAVIHTCPNPDGSFEIEATVDLRTSKGKAGQNVRIDLKIGGQVDDNAELAGQRTETRTQWADFGGPTAGQFIDHTLTRDSGGSSNITVSRSGGTVTDSFVSMSVLLSSLFAIVVADKLVGAAERAWKSGRCVRLDVTPSAGPKGLQPGQAVSVLAAPRSKIDGGATGGTVTALLSAGAKSIDPSSTPLPPDAEFTYSAPDEAGTGGTVSFEARSKRGVGKATLDFTTAVAPTVSIVGALSYSTFGLTGTASFTVTMVPGPDGTYSGTAEFQVVGALDNGSTSCPQASWTESLELMGTLTHENDDDVLLMSTTGAAPTGTTASRVCTTAGIGVPSQTSLISSTLIGDMQVTLRDGEQPFVDTLSPATGTLTITLS